MMLHKIGAFFISTWDFPSRYLSQTQSNYAIEVKNGPHRGFMKKARGIFWLFAEVETSKVLFGKHSFFEMTTRPDRVRRSGEFIRPNRCVLIRSS